MLLSLVAATLIALLAGQALPRAFAASPALWAHVALALGVMPLITAAMQHFVPVLCRTRGARGWMARLPWLMLAAGGVLAAAFAGVLSYEWVSAAALLGLSGVVLMLAWMLMQARLSLGSPHPGMYWYVAAMACLALALAAALMIPFFPAWHVSLRAFHLHLNLYGFVALTAVGTLQVLMPTAAGQGDPGVARRLRIDLPWAVAGSLSIAVGQAAWPVFLGLGVALWYWVLGRMIWAWWRLHRSRLGRVHGAEPVLLAATAGLGASLAGLFTGADSGGPLALFLPAFLMPLVTGAAGVLAPVWLHPADPALHMEGRNRLNRWGGLRALLFLAAAVLPLLGYRCAGMPALTALFWFGMLFAVWLYRSKN